ncbi:MAG: hypothetical protein Q9196_007040 [Gyalolechia fulgens]
MASSDPSDTDLLIIGSGPAGLMAAAWASQYDVRARIIDDKPDRVQTGHADGLTCRTMEILDSFGLAAEIQKEASADIEMRSWGPGGFAGEIERKGVVVSQKAGVSRFQQCLLNQGRLEELFQNLSERGGKIKVERRVKTLQLSVNKREDGSIDNTAHPVLVTVQHGVDSNRPHAADRIRKSRQLSPNESFSNLVEHAGQATHNGLETIRAKYVIGCDGAHSWTRAQLGTVMKGDTTDAVWGVMDIVPLTDFRMKILKHPTNV